MSPEHDGRATDVSWRMGATTMHATTSRPEGPGPFPAVVTVAGSGPTDRDWCSPLIPGSNGSARLLADELAQRGVFSLRYDKRVAGRYAADNLPHLIGTLSMASHAAELASAVGEVAAHPDVRVDRIFAVANSEGTLHALNYQLHQPEIPLAGLVLIAPPGRSVGEVAREQIARQFDGDTGGHDLIAYYDEAVARFRAGEPAAPHPALPDTVRQLIDGLENPANLPFARELWSASAAALLADVDVPVLVIIGRKDIQVDWRRDGEALQRGAAGRPDVTFAFPENADHVLKQELRPIDELNAATALEFYNSSAARLDPESLTIIASWIQALTRPAADAR